MEDASSANDYQHINQSDYLGASVTGKEEWVYKLKKILKL